MCLLPFAAGNPYPAPLSPLVDNGSIAWSVRALVQYIRPNTWPGKLQSSLLGYFPGSYETATGDTDAPSRHSCAARLLLLLPYLQPSSGFSTWRSPSIASCIKCNSSLSYHVGCGIISGHIITLEWPQQLECMTQNWLTAVNNTTFPKFVSQPRTTNVSFAMQELCPWSVRISRCNNSSSHHVGSS